MNTTTKDLTVRIAANITYSGLTYNTPLILEYQHTGEFYFLKTSKGIHILSGIESANEKKSKRRKVYYHYGYYFIKRVAIPTINADGKKSIWYINNSGDSYSINKVSKYGRKIHAELSKENYKPYLN